MMKKHYVTRTLKSWDSTQLLFPKADAGAVNSQFSLEACSPRGTILQTNELRSTSNTARNRYNSLLFHLHTIWLFTFSDLKTIVGPKSLFGLLNASAGPIFGIYIKPHYVVTPLSIVRTALWTWINLLPFVIDNQRREESIREDQLNKPWRPMPARRLSPLQAKVLMLILYPIAFSSSMAIGGWRQCVSLIVLGIWYNNHGGSSRYISRNFINACGFICYASGAMEVALGVALPATGPLIGWLLLIATVVFTTVQTQDLYDQAGDRACGRSTMPLALGDWECRLITVLAMLIWLWVCPAYWKVSIRVAVIFACMGSLIMVRLILKRTVAEDKTTFKLWNAWILFLYTFPLIKYAELTLA